MQHGDNDDGDVGSEVDEGGDGEDDIAEICVNSLKYIHTIIIPKSASKFLPSMTPCCVTIKTGMPARLFSAIPSDVFLRRGQGNPTSSFSFTL